MPGLCGVVAATEKRIDTESWHRAKQAHALDGVDFVDSCYLSDRCLLGNVVTASAYADGQTPKVGQRDSLFAMVEGELFETDDLRRRFRSSATDAPSLLLDGYLAHGERFLEHVNGEFNVVIYDAAAHSLRIFVDHLASQPLYVLETADGLVFGSEKKLLQALTVHPFAVDPVGIMQTFTHIHNVGDRTFISGLRRLESGTQVVYENGRLRFALSSLLTLEQAAGASRDEIRERWQAALRAATARRVRQPRRVQMSLSAGLDSRAVACAIARDHRPIHARTWGVEESQEVRYASALAERLNFDHFVENPLDFRHSDALHPVVWRTEGEIQYRNGISIFSHRTMRGLGDFVAGGWLGDASSGAHLRPFMFRPMERRQFIERVFRWYCIGTPQTLRQIFQSHAVDEYFPQVRELFFRSYDRVADVDNVPAHEQWDLYQRQTRMTISSMPVDSHLFQKIRPFLDREYLQFVMSLPMRFRLGQSIYKSAIYDMGPEIRSVPNSNTDQPLRDSSARNFVDYVLHNRHKVYRKIGEKIGVNYRAKNLIAAEDLGNSLRRDVAVKHAIEGFLASDYFDEALFNADGIRRLLHEHYESVRDYSVPISWLATYAAALPYFVYDRPPACPPGAQPLITFSS